MKTGDRPPFKRNPRDRRDDRGYESRTPYEGRPRWERDGDAPRDDRRFSRNDEGGGFNRGGGGGDFGSHPPRSTYRRSPEAPGFAPRFSRDDKRPQRFSDRPYGGGNRHQGGGGGRPYGGDRHQGGERSFDGDRAPSSARPPQAVGQKPVPAHMLKEGMRQANRALSEVMEQFGRGIQGDYDIGEIQAVVSFAADGRFMGFGEGGNASFTISLMPLSAEDVLAREVDDVVGDGALDSDDAASDDDDDELDVDIDSDADDEDDGDLDDINDTLADDLAADAADDEGSKNAPAGSPRAATAASGAHLEGKVAVDGEDDGAHQPN